MSTTEIMQRWRSVHSDYLQFAILAFRACRDKTATPIAPIHLDRDVVDSIRYSYDCFESAVEFVYHMGQLKQLDVSVPENWLTRYIGRNWGNLSLSDRAGILVHAWVGQNFWQTDDQIKVFEEWKRVRDALTHPVPFGTEMEREIISRKEREDGSTLTLAQSSKETKQVGKKTMVFSSRNPIADFAQYPSLLGRIDAEKSLEISLRLLGRLESSFFSRPTTWFCFYEQETNSVVGPEGLLKTLDCKFGQIW